MGEWTEENVFAIITKLIAWFYILYVQLPSRPYLANWANVRAGEVELTMPQDDSLKLLHSHITVFDVLGKALCSCTLPGLGNLIITLHHSALVAKVS